MFQMRIHQVSTLFTIMTQHVKSLLYKQMDELSNNVESLESVYDSGEPIGSGWALQSVHGFEFMTYLRLNQPRLIQTYIPYLVFRLCSDTVLINTNHDDEQCFI